MIPACMDGMTNLNNPTQAPSKETISCTYLHQHVVLAVDHLVEVVGGQDHHLCMCRLECFDEASDGDRI